MPSKKIRVQQGMLNTSVTVSLLVTIFVRAPDGSTQSNPCAVTRTAFAQNAWHAVRTILGFSQ